MNFKRRTDVGEPMSLNEAIKELKSEPLIDHIKRMRSGIEITTKMLATRNPDYHGVYFITIKDHLGRPLSIKIKRKGRKRDENVHNHIHPDYMEDGVCMFAGICWGNVYSIVKKLEKAKDYYWLAKLSIDLIKDDRK